MNDLNFAIVSSSLPYLWDGLKFSLYLTAFAFVTGIFLGTMFALIQHFEIPILGTIVRAYITVIRSIPLILVLFWFFFLVPLILGRLTGGGRPMPIGATWTAFITFGLFEAAYYSEIIKVGLRSLSRGQFEAAQALALTTGQSYRSVILPQVARVVSPIILSQTIILFQDTSLVYVLSLTDLVGAATKLAQLNGRIVEMYIVVAVVYLAICSSASQVVTILKRRAGLYASTR
ncbi:UNVERIFIED_ORG: glutamate/aspartate transport system permease protein [Bradyrhizobium japonicum]|uniref:amino acid ABC transporter permease n=1 Tax=Bradyrhizobium diazoefficiens TaxID=1355477 RepID=UPI003471CC5F